MKEHARTYAVIPRTYPNCQAVRIFTHLTDAIANARSAVHPCDVHNDDGAVLWAWEMRQ